MNTFNQFEYQNNYNKEKYDRITIMVPKGDKKRLQMYAEKLDLSLNAYIKLILENELKK